MKTLLPLLFALYLPFLPVWAADSEFVLIIRNHSFEPADLRVPARKKIRLVVHNQDTTPEEFESHELNREKVIGPNSKATIFIGPLAPGRYPFIGEFHEKTARGAVIAE